MNPRLSVRQMARERPGRVSAERPAAPSLRIGLAALAVVSILWAVALVCFLVQLAGDGA